MNYVPSFPTINHIFIDFSPTDCYNLFRRHIKTQNCYSTGHSMPTGEAVFLLQIYVLSKHSMNHDTLKKQVSLSFFNMQIFCPKLNSSVPTLRLLSSKETRPDYCKQSISACNGNTSP